MKNPFSVAKIFPYRPLLAAALCGLLLGAASASGSLACSSNQIGGTGSGSEDMTGGGGGGGGGDGGGGGGGGDDGGGQSAYCSGKGPPIIVGDSSGAARCSGQVAASAFRYAMCLCQGLSASNPITTDAFDSTQPGQTTFGNGGSVGINSNVNTTDFNVGGSLMVTGAVTLNKLVVGVDAQLSDTLSANQSADIKRSANIGGDVKCNGAAGSLKVTNTLNYPSTRTLTANAPVIGSTTRNAVTVATPCDCAGNNLFNISGYVAERKTNNDNAAIGLDADRFNNIASDQTLNLNCGRFYLNRIGGAGKITLNVSGRTALFIGGDVNLTDVFSVNLGTSGELDLFIDGGLTSSAPLNFGNKNTPARVRLYMGGSRNINLSKGGVLGGNVYAPQSALVVGGSKLEVFGALFVSSFNPSVEVVVHHDVAILRAAEDCTNPGTGGGMDGGTTTPPNTNSCTKCQDCGGQACKGGSCGACTIGADCCSPLSCKLGKCVFEVG